MKILLHVFIASIALGSLAAEESHPVRLGWIGPLSGAAAILGVDSLPAVELALEESSGFELTVEDDQYETSKTVAAYNRLVHGEGIKILFVLTYGGLFALAPRAERDGVLLIDTLDCDEHIARLPDNVLCIAKTTEQIGELNAEAALKSGAGRAAILYYNSDPFMGTVAEATIRRLKDAGAGNIFAEGYGAGTTDFRTLLLKARTAGAQSLFLYGYDEMGHAARQARGLGFKGPFFGTNTFTSPGLRELAKGADEGTIVSSYKAPRTKSYDAFIRRFEKKTGRVPQFEVSTFPSYDAAKLIVRGAQEIESAELARALAPYLIATRDYAGLSGTISIDRDGATRSLSSEVFVVQGGELVRLAGKD